MNRLALTIVLVLCTSKWVIANLKKEMFELSLANNTPQQSLITKTKFRCALACLERSECLGFNYGSPANGAYSNCFMYDWLTLGEGDVHVFAIAQEESTPDLMRFGEHSNGPGLRPNPDIFQVLVLVKLCD